MNGGIKGGMKGGIPCTPIQAGSNTGSWFVRSWPDNLQQVPEEQVVIMDTSLSNDAQLLNVVSLERYKLPAGGQWEL